MFDSGGDSVILYCINSWLDVLQATDKSIIVWLIWEVWLKLMPCLDWNIGKLGHLRTGTSCGVQGGACVHMNKYVMKVIGVSVETK